MKLKRELNLFSTTLYGTGVIIGAGIYALIGVGAGFAGNMLWLAFLISAIIAAFTGLSYAELSGRFPKEAAEYNYTKKAFKKETLSFAIGWILAIAALIAASAVALGFGGYFENLFGIDARIAAAGLIIIMSVLNYLGIKESVGFNNLAAIIEIGGLLLVVIAVLFLSKGAENINYFELPETGFAGMMTAVSIIFFAFVGFESIANISEEVKNSRKIVPKALILALIISTVFYMLISIISISEVGWKSLSESSAPLTLVVSKTLGQYSIVLSIIALIATANTVLISLIAGSRIFYGMAAGRSIPKKLAIIGKTGTPVFSIILVGVASAVIAYLFDIKTVAQLSDLSIFLAYTAVNASLIVLAERKPSEKTFTSPRVFGIPVFAWFGATTSFFMLAAFELELWIMEAVLIILGLALFWYAKKQEK